MKVHADCTSIPVEAHSILIKYAAEIGWVCDDCKTAMNTLYHRLQSSISLLTEELSITRTQLNAIQQNTCNVKADELDYRTALLKDKPRHPVAVYESENENYAYSSPCDSHIPLVVHRTLNDNTRR